MNASHQRWLLEQLPDWEKEGLISPDAARTLRERYPADRSQPGLAQIVMGVLGALLVGTGLIAVIGYNWDDFARPVRLLFAFLPLLLTQLFSMRVLHRGGSYADWVREPAGLLQTLATGACIALVSQIYNLGGAWPDFLFWWFLLSLPLAWVLRAHAVALFYLIAITVWTVSQIDHGEPWHDGPLLYPLLLLGLLPYWPGWRGNAVLPVTVRWFMCISAFVGLAAVTATVTRPGSFGDARFYFCWTLTAAGMVLFPLTGAGIAETNGRKPQVVLGTLWLLGYGLAGTFLDQSDDILKGAAAATLLPWGWGLLAVVSAFAALAVRSRRWAVLAITSVALLPLIVSPFVHGDRAEDSTVLSWLFTLHLAAIGITLIVLDVAGRRGSPRLGAALFSVLIIARMADSGFSLLAKGLVFIAVGVAFLAFNIYMGRHHRRQTLLPA